MRLSICIPTYNRGAFIGRLLESIATQAGYGCELEVVVSDNASDDDTAMVVEQYRRRLPSLVYHLEATNVGADRNYLKAVALASGDYCWLMGSDDLVEPGGIGAVERILASNSEVGGLYLRRNAYDFALQNKITQPISDHLYAEDTTISGSDQIFTALGQFVGYLSANVVDRRLWQHVVDHHDLTDYCNAWVHVFVIGRMMQQRPTWIYVAQPWVGWRSGNDSFLSEGQYRRLEIDVAGYEQVARGLFGLASPVYRHVMSRILKHARFRVLHAKMHGAPASFFQKVRALMNRYYRGYPVYWLTTYPLLHAPAPIIKAAGRLYTSTLKPIRVAQANR